jgi:hypothetical protein
MGRVTMTAAARSIFVLEIADTPAFAFEAEGLSQAEEFAHAPWFTRALDKFHSARHQAPSCRQALRTRAATEAEAALYRDVSREFADAFGCLLVARLPDRVHGR